MVESLSRSAAVRCYGARVVVDEVKEVGALVRGGVDVVLLVDPAAGHVSLPAGGPGRVAVLIGRLDDEAARSAAAQMAAELFDPPRSKPPRLTPSRAG
jgi:hypothetical protein